MQPLSSLSSNTHHSSSDVPVTFSKSSKRENKKSKTFKVLNPLEQKGISAQIKELKNKIEKDLSEDKNCDKASIELANCKLTELRSCYQNVKNIREQEKKTLENTKTELQKKNDECVQLGKLYNTIRQKNTEAQKNKRKLEEQCEKLEGEVAEKKRKLDHNETRNVKLYELNEKLIKSMRGLEEQYKKLEEEVSEKGNKLNDNELKVKGLNELNETLLKSKRKLEEQYEKLEGEVAEKRRKLDQCESKNAEYYQLNENLLIAHNEAQAHINLALKELEEMKLKNEELSRDKDQFFICYQRMPSLQEQLNTSQKEYAELRTQYEQLENSRQKSEILWSQKLDEQEKRIQGERKDHESLQNRYNKQKEKLSSFNATVEEFCKEQEKSASLQIEVKKLKKEKNQFSIQLKKQTDQIAEISTLKENLRKSESICKKIQQEKTDKEKEFAELFKKTELKENEVQEFSETIKRLQKSLEEKDQQIKRLETQSNQANMFIDSIRGAFNQYDKSSS